MVSLGGHHSALLFPCPLKCYDSMVYACKTGKVKYCMNGEMSTRKVSNRRERPTAGPWGYTEAPSGMSLPINTQSVPTLYGSSGTWLSADNSSWPWFILFSLPPPSHCFRKNHVTKQSLSRPVWSINCPNTQERQKSRWRGGAGGNAQQLFHTRLFLSHNLWEKKIVLGHQFLHCFIWNLG